MRNKMRAKTRNFFTGFAIIFALILIAFPSSAATSGGGVSLADNTRQAIYDLNPKSNVTVEPDAKPFMMCTNLVFNVLLVTSDISEKSWVLNSLDLNNCKQNTYMRFISKWMGELYNLIFEVAVLFMVAGVIVGIFKWAMFEDPSLVSRSVILFAAILLFNFVIKSIIYLIVLYVEAASTASAVNYVAAANKSNVEYASTKHADLFEDNLATIVLLKAKAVELRTGPAKFLKNLDSSWANKTPTKASAIVYENSKYELTTDKEGLITRTPEVSQKLRESWPDGKLPLSHSWISKTNDGWFSSDKENFPSTLLTFGYGLTPASEIGNESTDANSIETQAILAQAVANAPASRLVALVNDVKAKVKPSFLADNTSYKNLDYSYIAKSMTAEQIKAVSTITGAFAQNLTDNDYVAGVVAALSINAASQKGAGGEVVSFFNQITEPVTKGLSFLCSKKAQENITRNRNITTKLNSSGSSIADVGSDIGNVDYGCVLMTANGFQPLGYLVTEAEQAKEAAAEMYATKTAMNIVFNSIDKAQADASAELNLVNESSNLVKSIRIASQGTAALPGVSKYIAGSSNTAVQLIESAVDSNLAVASAAIDYPNLFDEQAVFGDMDNNDSEAANTKREALRKIMGNPDFDIFFSSNAVTDVRNISAATKAKDIDVMERIQNRFSNVLTGGFSDDLRHGAGIPKEFDLQEGAWKCAKQLGCNEAPTLYEFNIFMGKQMVSKAGMCIVGVQTIRTVFEAFKVDKLMDKMGGIGKKLSWMGSLASFVGKALIVGVVIAADSIYPFCVGGFTMGVANGYVMPEMINFSFLPVVVTLSVMLALFLNVVAIFALMLDVFNPDYRLTKQYGKKIIGIVLAYPVLVMIFKMTTGLLSIPASVVIIPLLLTGGETATVGISLFLSIIVTMVVFFYVIKELMSSATQIVPDFLRAFEIGGEKLFQDRGFFDKGNQQLMQLGAGSIAVKAVETGTRTTADKIFLPMQKAYNERKDVKDEIEAERAKAADKEVDFKDLGKQPPKV